MNIFCYIATNKDVYLNQTIFSIMSLIAIKQNKFDKIIIFTDLIDSFKSFFENTTLNIEYHLLDKPTIAKWTEPTGNIFKIKLTAFTQIWNMYPEANIIFLDSDTIITNPLSYWFDKIAQGTSLMNTDEGRLKNSPTYGIRKTYQALKSQSIVIDDKPFDLPEWLHMYNAGVIGMGANSKSLMNKVIAFHDDFHRSTGNYFSEQLSLSYVLTLDSKLETCDDNLIHYWYVKEFQTKIDETIEKLKTLSWEEKLKLTLPIQKLPTRKKFKSWAFAVPFKLKRKLYRMGLIKSYIDFD